MARTAASREAAQAAADRLEELGLLNDRAFAESYARELIQRKRYGLRRVRQELARKGIPRDMAEEVLAPYGEEDSAGENIRLVLSKRYACGGRTKRSAPGRGSLQRLGYSYEQVREVMGGLDTE